MKLPGSKDYEAQMAMHSITQKYYVSLAQEFQKHLSNESR